MMHIFLPYSYFVIGLAILLYGLFKKDKKAILRQTGIQVEGIIFDMNRDYNTSIENEIISQFEDTNNKVVVRFVTEQLTWITAPINQDFRLFYLWQYSPGDKVLVFYDRDKPDNFYVDTKQSALLGRTILVISGVLLLLLGFQQMFPSH
jgi:hypothetical protein